MSSTLETLTRLRKLAQSMNPKIPAVDQALPATRALFHDAKIPFKIVRGIAVVHHGYPRATEDIDVLVPAGAAATIDAALAAHGFVKESHGRLRHASSGVRVDLLFEGEPIPRSAGAVYPAVSSVSASSGDADVASLRDLLTLKLHAHRHQDLADVVALLKKVDDARFVELESEVPAELRKALSDLRRDAKEELEDAGD